MYKRQVKFYWFRSVKLFTVSGKTIDEITNKCYELCDKYHAIHFEIL